MSLISFPERDVHKNTRNIYSRNHVIIITIIIMTLQLYFHISCNNITLLPPDGVGRRGLHYRNYTS